MMRGQEVQRNPEVTEWIFADKLICRGEPWCYLISLIFFSVQDFYICNSFFPLSFFVVSFQSVRLAYR